MFRLQSDHLAPDPTYEADLAKLGFFLNSKGQFRMIKYPDKVFNFHHSNNERDNEVRREAFQTCQRREVLDRINALGLQQLYIPQLSYDKPQNEAFVPILAPPAEILKTRKRIIVLVNSTLQDLGVLAYRRLQRELGVDGGSIVDFVKELIARSMELQEEFDIFKDGVGVEDPASETPGVIVMNCGQLLFSYKFAEAKTVTSWNAMPRKSAATEPPQITEHNQILSNEDTKTHIRFVLDNVIKNKRFVAEDAEVYMIAIENGATNLAEILDADFQTYGSRIAAMAIVDSQLDATRISNGGLRTFLHRRAREWVHDNYTNDPRGCVALPFRYNKEVKALELAEQKAKDSSNGESSSAAQDDESTHAPHWLEKVPGRTVPSVTSILSSLTNGIKKITIGFDDSTVPDATEPDQEDPNAIDDCTAVCPVFADAENPTGAGECIFTARTVQKTILDFFEEVARHPKTYHNPSFTIRAKPTDDPAFDKPSSESHEIEEMNAKLENMRAALRDTPATENLKAGREKLEQRIAAFEHEIEEFTKKALAFGNLGAGEGQEVRENWEPTQGGGPKIPFAGSMVDAERVRAAGLDEYVDEELERLLHEEGGGQNGEENGNGYGKTQGGGPKIPFAGFMVDGWRVRAAGLDEDDDEELEKLLREEDEGQNGNGNGHGNGAQKE